MKMKPKLGIFRAPFSVRRIRRFLLLGLAPINGFGLDGHRQNKEVDKRKLFTDFEPNGLEGLLHELFTGCSGMNTCTLFTGNCRAPTPCAGMVLFAFFVIG